VQEGPHRPTFGEYAAAYREIGSASLATILDGCGIGDGAQLVRQEQAWMAVWSPVVSAQKQREYVDTWLTEILPPP
jgi:hypothetical protein